MTDAYCIDEGDYLAGRLYVICWTIILTTYWYMYSGTPSYGHLVSTATLLGHLVITATLFCPGEMPIH